MLHLQLLADYTIKHHFPEIKSEGVEKYLAFFQAVTQTTLGNDCTLATSRFCSWRYEYR